MSVYKTIGPLVFISSSDPNLLRKKIGKTKNKKNTGLRLEISDIENILFRQQNTKKVVISLLSSTSYEPRCEKTGLWGFRPGPTQTGLYNDRRWLEI